MEVYEELENEIDQIERDTFHKIFLRGIMMRHSFCVIITDINDATYDEKEEIRNLLIEHGISQHLLTTDNDLHVATRLLMSRAVSLR